MSDAARAEQPRGARGGPNGSRGAARTADEPRGARGGMRRWQRARVGAGRGRPAPTGRGVLLLFLGTVLYAAGANVSSGWTLLVAAMALGGVGWALLLVWRTAAGVDAARVLPEGASTDRRAAVGVRVRGGGLASVLAVDPGTGLVGVADRGADLVEALVALPRGRAGGGELLLRVTDPLGLAAAWRRVADDRTLLVLPAAASLLGRDRGGQGGGGERDGGEPSQRRDPGPELLGLREHQQGDPLATVHWRATARRDELVSRDARQPRQEHRDVVLEAGEWDRERLDLAVAVVVELAEEGVAVGRPVTVCADRVRLAWGPAARAHLAGLPPAAGVPARPLRPTELDPRADVVHVVRVAGGIEVRGDALGSVPLALSGAAASGAAAPGAAVGTRDGGGAWDA